MSRKTLNQNGNQKGVNAAQSNNGCQKPSEPLKHTSNYVRKEDTEIVNKLQQVMELTGKNEEIALMTLHDCEYDLERTIDFLFESEGNNKTMEISVVGQTNNKSERNEPVNESQQWSVSTAKRNMKKPVTHPIPEQNFEPAEKDFSHTRETRRRSKPNRSNRAAPIEENGFTTTKENHSKDDSSRWQGRPAWKTGRVYTNKKKSQEEEILSNLENISLGQSEKEETSKHTNHCGVSDAEDEWTGESLVVTNKTVVADEIPKTIAENLTATSNWADEEDLNSTDESKELTDTLQPQSEPIIEQQKATPAATIFISRDCSQTRPVPSSTQIPDKPIAFALSTRCSADILTCAERYHFGNSEVIDEMLQPPDSAEETSVEVPELLTHKNPQSDIVEKEEADLTLTESPLTPKTDLNGTETSLYVDFTSKSLPTVTNDGKQSQSATPDKSIVSDHFVSSNEQGSYPHQDLTKAKSLPSDILNQSRGSSRGQLSNSYKHESNSSISAGPVSTSDNPMNSNSGNILSSSHAPYYPPHHAPPLINPSFPLPNNNAHFSPNNYDLDQQQPPPHMAQMNHQNFMFEMDSQQSHLNHEASAAANNNRKIDTTAAPGLYHNPAIYYLAALAANPQFYNQFFNINPLMPPVTNNSNQNNTPIVTSVNQPYTNMKPMNNFQGFNPSYNHSQNYEDSDLSQKFNKPVYGPSKNNSNYNSATDSKSSLSQGNPAINSSGHHPAVSAYAPQNHHAPPYPPGGIYGNSWAGGPLHTIIPPPQGLAAMNSGHPSQPMGMHLVGHPQ